MEHENTINVMWHEKKLESRRVNKNRCEPRMGWSIIMIARSRSDPFKRHDFPPYIEFHKEIDT